MRRDLQDLSSRRAIARTYGGAMLARPGIEQSLSARAGQSRAAKAAIAEAALARIADGEKSIDIMNRTQGNDDWITLRPWPTSPATCIVPHST